MLIYQLVSLLPKNFQSYVVGVLSRINWPARLSLPMNKILVKILKIDLRDAERPLGAYSSLEDLFTRKLKVGSRPVQAAFCSPCDSILRYSHPVKNSQLIQAKGLDYTVQDLLKLNGESVKTFEAAWAMCFYLAPHNYHRVHAPFDAKLASAHYIPGELWPVNDRFVNKVPRLFCRNERVVFELNAIGGGKAYLVMVGALHVGRIQIKDLEFISNDFSRQLRAPKSRVFSFSPQKEVKAGEELGTFMLGSTVILVMDRNFIEKFPMQECTDAHAMNLGDSLLKNKVV